MASAINMPIIKNATTCGPVSTMPPDVVTPVAMWVQLVTIIACILSICGSLIIIFSFVAWKEIRTKSRQLLVYLSIADFLLALGYLYGSIFFRLRHFDAAPWDCIVQSAWSVFACTSTFLWTMAIAIYLYITIVQTNTELAERCIKYFHIVCWGVPAAIIIAALSFGVLGYDSSDTSVGWCWIDMYLPSDTYLLWMLITIKMWEFLTYLLLPALYISIKLHLYRQQRRHVSSLSVNSDMESSVEVVQQALQAMVRVNRKLTFIPVVFISLRIWSSIRFTLALLGSVAVSSPILVALNGVGNCSQGFANCVIFCFLTTRLRDKLKHTALCWLRCKCFTRKIDATETERSPLINE